MSSTDPLFPTSAGGPPAGDGDNITDWALEQFQLGYESTSITKDDIWEYVYGVMHAPDWRETYKADLRRSLPRIPFAADFEAFRAAGRELMDLHLNYETGPECLEVTLHVNGEQLELDADGVPVKALEGEPWRIERQMFWADSSGKRLKKQSSYDASSRLHINPRSALGDIPEAARAYQVSGRSPLEWAMAVLRNETDKTSGIHSDPNTWDAWVDEPFNLVRHLRRLTHLAVRSAEIIADLPPSLDGPAVPAFAAGGTSN